ncbi:XRE family transcriptional regulator [Sphingobium sp.]|uniref:XRE family transcriptional regulator n=1 Tax=Sphingobium sp. TaxID=1912891 RepID=UPI0028BDCED5|nr:S24 family peptidase [Sphingobium sp.]
MTKKLPITAIRVRERMEETGTTQEDLAEAVGATQGAISQILTGATRNSRLLPKIAENLAVNLSWLIGASDEKIDMFDAAGESISEDDLAAIRTGLGHKRLAKPEQLRIPKPVSVEVDEDLVEIDSIDLKYGMGGTFLDTDHIEVEKVKFSRSWISQFTNSPPHMLCSTKGAGDSMMPTIHDQDVVIIDRSQTRPEMGDKIWAIVYSGWGMIKRLRAQPDGTIRISSDNQLIRDDFATDGDLFIVGRVVAVVKSV